MRAGVHRSGGRHRLGLRRKPGPEPPREASSEVGEWKALLMGDSLRAGRRQWEEAQRQATLQLQEYQPLRQALQQGERPGKLRQWREPWYQPQED